MKSSGDDVLDKLAFEKSEAERKRGVILGPYPLGTDLKAAIGQEGECADVRGIT